MTLTDISTIGPVRHVTGYVRGRQVKILVTQRCGFWVECGTAVAYDLLANAARKDGIDLPIVSGWRSMEKQEALWNERQCACTPPRPFKEPHEKNCPLKTKGPAARPGYSNHQSGRAIDLDVQMTVHDLKIGRQSVGYQWLLQRAYDFGFERTVLVEPWHWELARIPEDRT